MGATCMILTLWRRTASLITALDARLQALSLSLFRAQSVRQERTRGYEATRSGYGRSRFSRLAPLRCFAGRGLLGRRGGQPAHRPIVEHRAPAAGRSV